MLLRLVYGITNSRVSMLRRSTTSPTIYAVRVSTTSLKFFQTCCSKFHTEPNASSAHHHIPAGHHKGDPDTNAEILQRQWPQFASLLPPSSYEVIRQAIVGENHTRFPFRVETTKLPRSKNIKRWIRWISNRKLSPQDRMLWLHRVVTSCLSTKEECIEFVSAFKDFGILLVPDTVAGLLPTEVPAVETVLKVYNAVLQRLKRFQVPLSEDMILYGIQLAGLAKSTAAMKKFVELSLNPDLEHHLKLITITLRHFHKWADTECFDDPHGQRQKQQLGLILTGHKGRGTSGTMEREAGCVYHLMTARGGSIRWRYLDAVRKFSGTNALFEEWLDFNKSTLQMRKVVNHNQGDLEALQIWNKFIREFILAGDVPKAWRVVEESGLPFTEVSNSTWETMFEHAEQISEWHGVMEPRLLRRYYRLLRGIEYAMGIQWTGGEHGEHIPRRRSSLSDDIE